MKTTIMTYHEIADHVIVKCSPVEWLIINKALHQFAKNEINHMDDIKKVDSMLRAKPEFCEMGGIGDGDSN